MKNKIEKIIVKAEDELIDIVREISFSKAKKILITFVENSDILISSINLKVLLDSADEKDSLLILQILNNPSGLRNAKLAGITVVDTPPPPTEEVWEEVDSLTKKRKEQNLKTDKNLPQDYKSKNITSFEERINSVITKSQEAREEQPDQNVSPKDDIVIDKDLTVKDDLTKVDFKNAPSVTEKHRIKKGKVSLSETFTNFLAKFKKKPKEIQRTSQGITVQESKKEKLLKLLPKIVIPLVLVLALVLFLYYYFAPYIKTTIFIESKPVEIEKVFIGNENINEIDFENGEIPIKTETVTKSASDIVDATGTAYRGDKATGSVTVSYINPDGCTEDDEPINLTEGHQISTDSKVFVLTGSVTVTCNNFGTVGVEAVDVGEEYNIASGKYFSVADYDSTKVYAVNSAAFTGGSKEQYTVLSQQDVNTKVEELTEIATDEAENSLHDIGNSWELIDETIKSEVKEGSIDTTVAIGTETTSSDISLEVESSATYYYTEGVDEGLNDLLTEAALNQNLFESGEGLTLTLTEDIEKELSVSEDDGEVEITLTASSSVEPSVNREDLINDLRGMSWEEGLGYLNDLTFTADHDPVVKFTPENFPQKLKYFPSRQGRIDLTVEKIIKNGD